MSRPAFDVKDKFTGTGAVKVFTFDFKIEALTQLLVVEYDAANVETQRVLGTDVVYIDNVVFDGEAGGGTVTLAANLATDFTLIFLLANDLPTQDFNFRDRTSFTLTRIENALDFAVGPIQRLKYQANQALRINDFDDQTVFNGMLPPDVVANADRTIVLNPTGTAVIFGPTVTTVNGAVTSAANAATSAAAALVSENNASTSEGNASTSAAAALVSENNASTSEGNASTSAAAALVSENNAAVSAAEAAADASKWVKVTKTFADFSVAALTTDIEILSLPADEILAAFKLKITVAFVGTGVTSLLFDTGVTGDLNKFSDSLDGLTINNKLIAVVHAEESDTGVTSIKLRVTANVNLDNLSVGTIVFNHKTEEIIA